MAAIPEKDGITCVIDKVPEILHVMEDLCRNLHVEIPTFPNFTSPVNAYRLNAFIQLRIYIVITGRVVFDEVNPFPLTEEEKETIIDDFLPIAYATNVALARALGEVYTTKWLSSNNAFFLRYYSKEDCRVVFDRIQSRSIARAGVMRKPKHTTLHMQKVLSITARHPETGERFNSGSASYTTIERMRRKLEARKQAAK